MSFNVPEDRRYTESHEWTEPRDDVVRIGITDFAQDELGDIVFVELPEVGDEIEAGESFGVVESIKAVSDIYATVSGEVAAVNDEIRDQPELVNDEPFDGGWLIEIETNDDLDHLLSSSEYSEQI
ncbi:glycine cleavage system protein GcvH [Haloterrigena sp. SYSU A121-1]|uniref:Probable glycine cleavage system H protein n=1 Tax=Haloterrigena gelatinilytica TaxID=2741724 RepID=A0A8J8KDS5_9EURY|nr:glycine cleavage system protein GcvH [Haloterrigena gelatinilytica]NUB93835.1 glycine cleavage system protein GcvH [Haloterrigena gelatinilytica]